MLLQDGFYLAGFQPHATQLDLVISPAEDRLAMVEAAVAGVPGLEASRLELDAGGTIKGVVVDTRGAPVPGAFVRVRDNYTTVTAGTDGSFVLGPVTEGEHDLVVMVADHYFGKPGADPDSEEPVGHVSVAAGQVATTRLVVELETSAITGVVVDGNGAPVRDAYVDLTASGGEPSPPVLTGDDGAFRFPAVKNARYRVHAYVAGRGEKYEDAEAGDKLEVKLESGELSGIVRGAPEELTVQLTGTAYRTETFFHTGGRFALHDLRQHVLPAHAGVLPQPAVRG